MTLFRGMYTALATPFDSMGKLDIDLLHHLLQYQINARVDGIVVLGTTGEAPTLSHEEQETIIQIAREVTLGKVPLLVGTGSYSTAQAIENTLKAQRMGADGALIVTPYYNRPSQEGLYQHFKAITEVVDLPILVYNHQGRTGQNLLPETLLRIAELPHICGVKEVPGQFMQLQEVIEQVKMAKPNFAVLCGDDALTFFCALLGGDGVISVASNLIPHSMRVLTHTALQDNIPEARELHYALMPLFRALCFDTNPIPLKAAMVLKNISVGSCRLPLCAPSSSTKEQIKEVLDSLASLLEENQAYYPKECLL